MYPSTVPEYLQWERWEGKIQPAPGWLLDLADGDWLRECLR